MNSTWDPKPKSGKLVALVDLVTTSPVDTADNFIGKLLDWDSKAVAPHTCSGMALPEDIKTTILISMAPDKMRMKLFGNL